VNIGKLDITKLQRTLVANSDLPRFTDTFNRLLGMHRLSQHFTAQLLGVSEATMSSWTNGKSTPSLAKAIDIAELFQITTDRLMGASFVDLLGRELSDPDRFARVEARIKKGLSPVQAV
jgi:DNA-binding XRE family transcriptional regulator